MVSPAGLTAEWVLPAEPASVGELRHRAADFASSAGVADAVVDAIKLAVSETVTNAVRHAYEGQPGHVRVSCRIDGDRVVVEVTDDGVGVERPHGTGGSGHGLALVGSLAQSLEITAAAGGRGTAVTMAFGAEPVLDFPPRWQGLCGLAVQTIADASCLDLVSGGILRRVAAEMHGEPALTAWLRSAVPPAKPGTATWAALREGGVRMVVHDPMVARSPGGTGERLDLLWWVAVPIQKPGAAVRALWGLGGRAGGKPMPSAEVLSVLQQASLSDLGQLAAQAQLRSRLHPTLPKS